MLGYMVSVCWICKKVSSCFPKVSRLFFISIWHDTAIFGIMIYCCCFNLVILIDYTVTHCGFNLCFSDSNVNDTEHVYKYCWPLMYLLWCSVVLDNFALLLFLNWVVRYLVISSFCITSPLVNLKNHIYTVTGTLLRILMYNLHYHQVTK